MQGDRVKTCAACGRAFKRGKNGLGLRCYKKWTEGLNESDRVNVLYLIHAARRIRDNALFRAELRDRIPEDEFQEWLRKARNDTDPRK